MTETKINCMLANLIERGGVYHNVKGTNPGEILANMVDLLPVFPGLNTDVLLKATLERETLMSTGIGRGIAVPHPRNPVLGEENLPFVSLGFPASAIDWNTTDGSKVHAVFLIVSVSAKQHLGTLSKINFLCQQEKIQSLIKMQALKEEIITSIREAEQAWAD
jgi:PTS system nitrogen regulatory IIA component